MSDPGAAGVDPDSRRAQADGPQRKYGARGVRDHQTGQDVTAREGEQQSALNVA